jgi:hypothetical protein
MKATPFILMNRFMYKLGPDNVLRWCTLEHERDNIIEEAHVGPTGGNFHIDMTTRKILQEGLWCPKIHKYY